MVYPSYFGEGGAVSNGTNESIARNLQRRKAQSTDKYKRPTIEASTMFYISVFSEKTQLPKPNTYLFLVWIAYNVLATKK